MGQICKIKMLKLMAYSMQNIVIYCLNKWISGFIALRPLPLIGKCPFASLEVAQKLVYNRLGVRFFSESTKFLINSSRWIHRLLSSCLDKPKTDQKRQCFDPCDLDLHSSKSIGFLLNTYWWFMITLIAIHAIGFWVFVRTSLKWTKNDNVLTPVTLTFDLRSSKSIGFLLDTC